MEFPLYRQVLRIRTCVRRLALSLLLSLFFFCVSLRHNFRSRSLECQGIQTYNVLFIGANLRGMMRSLRKDHKCSLAPAYS